VASQLADAATGGLDDLTQLWQLRQLWPALCAVQAQFARRIGQIHTTGAAQADGFAGTHAFLRGRLHVDRSTAVRLIRVGAALRDLVATAAALSAGLVSLEHADAIAQVATELATP
jgi:Domain of unknown function (DUF222)